ncbi:MAG: hypothetical protein IPG80_05585 [Anaerolineales bacterium]|uniref:hypothetical protein n=1 Tax=Candidatus Villigracilis vicinus TaxID=3140679 RepID=UPI0031363010|nr:hypothetical protein [Anaerolineales bacterium]
MQNLTRNLVGTLSNRIGGVIAAIGGAIVLAGCGALMTFVLAPGQAVKASQIAKMPQMDAQYVSAAAPGADILITGYLTGTAPNSKLPEFIAYNQEEWDVTRSTNTDGTPQPPSGSWMHVGTVVPNLSLDMNGSPVNVLSVNNAMFSGSAMHEEVVRAPSTQSQFTADYQGQPLPDGSMRYTGFFNGDLVTILGKKSSGDGVIPEELFSGDRVAFEQHQKDAAKALLFMGIAAMVCSPFIAISGVFAALLGRGKRLA